MNAEVIAQSQATATEKAFLGLVETQARLFASIRIREEYRNTVNPLHLENAFDGVDLSGLRAGWLTGQMELAQLCAEMDYGKISQSATLVREYQSALYGYALVLTATN